VLARVVTVFEVKLVSVLKRNSAGVVRLAVLPGVIDEVDAGLGAGIGWEFGVGIENGEYLLFELFRSDERAEEGLSWIIEVDEFLQKAALGEIGALIESG